MAFNSQINAAILVQPFGLLHQVPRDEASRTTGLSEENAIANIFDQIFGREPNHPDAEEEPNLLCSLARHMLREPWLQNQMLQIFSKVNTWSS